jgi:hypothetical protein
MTNLNILYLGRPIYPDDMERAREIINDLAEFITAAASRDRSEE